ncbi:hypothetical protein AY601_1339 [Pedobacter cryoconitis]|uniref:GmrSD restriction endonucleases N-terminal domain-containing protein n=1 Tax=Pedobacter cryoconitis TaxID=188932 RepID=A0A127VAL4_9SPHI|nr:DUF262 domain-containing protein [Pedobacter cryoconitis]AMP98257.1 hypothetical protein AY601_1339 [Pedobacter cryoconitis]
MSNIIQTTHRDIAWFKQANEFHQLQMKPQFQRNLVWTDKQKSFLIDSILNSYPVPELYMQDIISGDGSKLYIVVDGQQRITACLDFIDNQFQIDGKDSPSYAEMSFDDLSTDQKKKIYSYSFVVRLLPEMSDPEIREIFSRLNRNNVVLNAQELRQATYWGQFIQTMNEIADNDVWRILGVFTPKDVKRMLDVEFISELAVASIHGVQNKKLTLDKYYEIYEDEFPQRDETIYTFDLVTREISHLLPNINKTRWSKKTDFYTLFVLLSNRKDLLPLGQVKKALGETLLNGIGNLIDKYVSTDKEQIPTIGFDENIKEYSINLRASSDLGARKKREDALQKLLEPLFS